MKSGALEKIGHADNLSPNFITQLLAFILLVGLAVGIMFSGAKTVLNLTGLIALISVIYAALRLTACLKRKPKMTHDTERDEWPFYTVLVPLFHEANMVPHLMGALSKLDYPVDRLEIFMICEAVDPATIAEVRKRAGGVFHLIIVPPGSPQTKPRALNFAMHRARGEFVTIYDAEDIPHPQQLKFAVQAFENERCLGAVQAPLDYANANHNAITRQFGLEYAALFHVWLPFLSALGLPFPLGGTSNHMRREALDDVEGWDAHNVTEDADLSFRLAARNWSLSYITPPTQEEAVADFSAWHFQRARWMKGYMQSWRCHMRAPFAPGGAAGLARFFTLQLTLGLTLISALFHLPVMAGVGIYCLYQYLLGLPIEIPMPFLISLGISYAAGMIIGAVGALRAQKPALLLSVPFMPLYWFALCAPTLRALWELRRNPFHWHKTAHGVYLSEPLNLPPETLIKSNEYI
ncbi:glycosyltransferase [Hellea balneolensis]|uniref:glycosyltransferase n=1 Tax=Hellea balneolensis TaxID=287478 RepID=UPI000425F951|nr:glycosyltransferase [Hellea balneolensis]